MTTVQQNLTPQYGDEVGLLELLNVLLRRWRLVAGIPFVLAAATAGISLVLPATYTAETWFVPESGSSRRTPGLAAQLGITLGAEGSESPRFYAELARSREILSRTLLARYPDPRPAATPADSARLLDILEVEGEAFSDSLNSGRRRLASLVSATVQDRIGTVRVAVDSRYPALAAEVANRLVGFLNDFNAGTRRTQAGERRRFVEQRVAEAERELREAEEELRQFHERNRSWQGSPHLTIERERLARQVQVRGEVYLTLRREFETARIEEVNDTPVITVVDHAEAPKMRSKPRRKLMVVLAILFGGMVGAGMAFVAEYFDRARRSGRDDYLEFRSLLGGAKEELVRLAGRGRPTGAGA